MVLVSHMRHRDRKVLLLQLLKLCAANWFLFTCTHSAICPSGMFTFEKMAGVTMREAYQSPLLVGNSETPVTDECLNYCKTFSECAAVLFNYTQPGCFVVSSVWDDKRDGIAMTNEKVNYFEKICMPMQLSSSPCERSWIFERVVGRELVGFDERVVSGVESRLQCETLCLQETGFPCRSGEYDYVLNQCRLSPEDRRSQPSSFRASIGDVDYFENQCVSQSEKGCDYEQLEGVEILQRDALRTAFSPIQCRSLCDSNEMFLCRSFTYQPSSAKCWLSGDDTYSVGPRSLLPRQDMMYFQRSNCLDLKLTCSKEGMTLTLNTLEPFWGRIFAEKDSRACEVSGNGMTTTIFVMPLEDERCGVIDEGDGHFSNTIVIQHHPIIQRKGDRIIRLLCVYYASENKSVSNTYRVVVGGDVTVTSVVNATAATPNIRLRITDRNAEDVRGARVGDELYLRIEIDDDSVFGILARNLTARSGNQEDVITIIDNEGCPTDLEIFPPLERLPGSKTLQARFDAFKFPSDVVVRFGVNIHFCLENCRPAVCPGGVTSYGRKRRQIYGVMPTTQAPILPDYPLQHEIIVEGIHQPPVIRPTEDLQKECNSEDMICVSRTVMVAAIIAAVSIQIGLIAACISAIMLSRRTRDPEDTVSTYTSHLTPYGGGRTLSGVD